MSWDLHTHTHITEHILALFQIPNTNYFQTKSLSQCRWGVTNLLSPHNDEPYIANWFTYIFPRAFIHGFSTNMTFLLILSFSYDNHLSWKTGPHNSVSSCSVKDVQENMALGWVMITFYKYHSFISIQPWSPGLAGTRAQSRDWYGCGTLHPRQVLGGSLPLFSPAFRRSHFSCHVREISSERWNSGRQRCPVVILPKFRLPRKFRDLLHAGNLRHGTDAFTSPPKEGVLRIFSP